MKTPSIVAVLFLGLLSDSLGHRSLNRGFKYSVPSEESENIVSRLFGVPYGDTSRYLFRNTDEERREVEQSRPLCEEERQSLNIRELIDSGRFNFLQTTTNLDLRRYNLIPSKVDVIRCVGGLSEEKSEAVCKPENCKERKVDIEVFGRLKNETANVWQYVGGLPAVPVACECFVRWKPEKCPRSVEIFTDV